MLTATDIRMDEDSETDLRVVYIITLDTSEEMDAIARVKDVDRRIGMLRSLNIEAKMPVIDALSRYAGEGMEIISHLDGSPQLIAAGPKAAWTKFKRDNKALYSNPNISFRLNSRTWSVPDRGL